MKRRRLQDECNQLLWHLLVLSTILKGTTAAVRKCCPSFHVLNYDLSECVRHADSEVLREIQWGTIPSANAGDSVPQPSLILSSCPPRNRTEMRILRFDQHTNKVQVTQALGLRDTEEVEMIIPDENDTCIDAVLNRVFELEGPFLYKCSDAVHEAIVEVRKCCPLGSYLDVERGNCLEHGRNFQLPHRFVKHEATRSSTQNYLIMAHHHPDKSEGHCAFYTSVNEIYTNGRLSFGGSNTVEYSCIDSDSQGVLYAKVCWEKISGACRKGVTCIPKCCEVDEVFHYSNSRCVKVRDGSLLYFPKFHDDQGRPSGTQVSMQFKAFHMEHLVRKECSMGLYKVNENENIHLLEDGSLFHEGYGVSQSGFCVDNFVRSIAHKTPPMFSAVKCVEVEEQSPGLGNQSHNGPVKNVKLSVCESKMSRFNAVLRVVYTACGACSLLFLILTFVIYSLLPNFRNLHGKIVMSNILAIFLTTLFLIIAYNSNTSNHVTCVWTGYSLYYSGLSMFCWMSIMCFDLCWTFVRAKIPRKGSDRLKFCIYSIFAWTVPGIFCGLIGALDTWSKSFAPHVGKHNCFLGMKAARRFFYFPIFILLCFNVIMYLITIGTLWKSKQSSKKAGLTKSVGHRIQNREGSLRNSSQRKGGTRTSSRRVRKGASCSQINVEIREQLLLFTKLFLIMGITWISECIHVEIHGDHNNIQDCNFYLEVFLRIIGGLNMLRGFGFFVIFICKRSIYNSLQRKYPYFINILSSCPFLRSKQLPLNQVHSPRVATQISTNTNKTNQTELTTFTTHNLMQTAKNDGRRGSRMNILQECV